MKMKSKVAAVVLMLIFVCPAYAAECLRCGNRLVSVGDHMAKVAMNCGSPDMRYVESVSTVSESDAIRLGRIVGFENREMEYTTTEQWVYAPSGRQLRILTFERGRVIKIEYAD